MTTAEKTVRVVIPAYNAGVTLVDCLEAIIESTAFLFSREIIIVDNGRNTDLQKLSEKYPVTVLKRDESNSAAYARNEGAKGFYNGILVFIDSDVICEKNCIKELLEPVQNNLCQATIGNYSKNLAGLSFSQKYKQLYINHIYDRESSKIKNDFWTAIACVDANVFHKLNGFDSNFKGANGEDQEFGIRLTKNGYKVLSVKHANGQHLNPYGVYKIIRNDFRKGITAVKNSLDNKVPFSDNRHSKTADILSVLFSVGAVFFLFISILNFTFLFIAIGFYALWFLSRGKLSIAFLENGGILFCIRALLLMYVLDLVRFTCVLFGTAKNIFKKKIVRETNAVSIPLKT
jgi:glycosyltransferase involved in cell wall biosynthesis